MDYSEPAVAFRYAACCERAALARTGTMKPPVAPLAAALHRAKAAAGFRSPRGLRPTEYFHCFQTAWQGNCMAHLT